MSSLKDALHENAHLEYGFIMDLLLITYYLLLITYYLLLIT